MAAIPGMRCLIAISTTGADKTRLTQKRLLILMSSGFSSSSAVTVRGSRAIPHFGQSPGLSLTTSGCIGHVHSVFAGAASRARGSSAIPHLGQSPGLS